MGRRNTFIEHFCWGTKGQRLSRPLVQLKSGPIDAFFVKLGRRTFRVTPADVEHPPGIEVLDVNPKQGRVSVRSDAGAEASDRAARP